MQSLASFNAKRIKKVYLVEVLSLRRDDEKVVFQFDTGASMSLIGLNTIADDDEKHKELLKSIKMNKIQSDGIDGQKEHAKTVTSEEIAVYPCCLSGVYVMHTEPKALYFHIFLGDINLPLLGFDYVDDCTYHHSINGDIEILAVADDVGKKFYPDKVLDFDSVLNEYYKTIRE